MDGYSKDIVKDDIEKLRSIFPQCVVEGKVKIDQLLNILGEYEERDFEKYEFTWKGKNECYKVARERTRATLLPCESESVNFNDTQNIYIEGDNLEVLKILQQGYYNKIKMIYIDPPYNTGNDFVYKDNYKDSLANYKNIVSSTGKSNPETSGRFHTDWLNMMFPRLMLAHTLLKDDGVIFISIDDNEVDNLKKMCNEIFGENNFVDVLHWKKKKQPSFLRNHTAKVMEYVIVYAKNKELLEKLSIENLSDSTKKVINLSNEESIRYLKKGIKVKLDGKGVIKAGRYKIKTMEVEYLKDLFYENGRTLNDVEVISKFSVSQDNINKYIDEDLLFITTNKSFRRDVLEEEKNNKKAITDLLLQDYGDNQESANDIIKLFGTSCFDYSKPVKLIYNFIKCIESNNEIILDFFSGSATTAHAVMQLNAEDGGNRKYIMVQLPELCDKKTEAYKNDCK